MPAPRALRLLRPLLARPAQTRVGPARHESSCQSTPTPPCPPCEPRPGPPCRARPAASLPGRRVVCCPPPRGARPPCPPPAPAAALTCDTRLRQRKPECREQTDEACGADLQRVGRRMRAQDDARRAAYESDLAARRAAPPAPPAPPAPACSPAGPGARALANDGRAYTVLEGPPAPRCPPQKSRHPTPQPVTLAAPHCEPPLGDPCAFHHPRTLISIDRGEAKPSGPKECDGKILPADTAAPKPQSCAKKLRSESLAPGPLPKKQKSCGGPLPNNANSRGSKKTSGSTKGLTSRIMESLSRGRGGASPGRAAGKGGARRAGDSGWCSSPPPVAPAPPSCRRPTVAERLRRGSPPPCGRRRLHTTAGACAKEAPAAVGREDTVAAAEKLEAALRERDKLKAAGVGRVVRAPACEPPPRRPPAPSGGAMELRVPPGADTVCVRVSLGVAPPPTPHPPAPRPPAPCAPSPPCGGAPPAPRAPCGGSPPPPSGACSDSWLSIKKLQKKLSGCGPPKGASAPAPGKSPCGPRPPSAARPAPAGPCSRGPVKMAELVSSTIFIKS